MKSSAWIGVDVGTSGCKGVLLTSDRRCVSSSVVTYPTRRGVDGEATQDGRDWLRAVRAVLSELAQQTDAGRVEGIALTAPAHVGVLADEHGQPLTRSMLAWDGRSSAVAASLRARYGEELFQRTFVDLSASWTLPQIGWLHQARPSFWPRIRWLFTQKDWIRYHLTGVALVDHSDAAGTAMYDQRRGRWLTDVALDVGLSPHQLPPIVGSTAPGGALTRHWAEGCGLRAGTPVIVGATDTAAELVSLGVDRPGDSVVKIASTGTVVGLSSEPVVDRRLLTYPHAIPGLWYTLGATSNATTAYQWLRQTLFSTFPERPAVAYAALDALATRVPAGAAGVMFLPFLSGERTPYWDPDLRAAFIGLSSSHRREHLVRAVLEGVAFGLRTCRDTMVDAGLTIEHPHLAGGGMASRLWRSILVSALGEVGRVVEPQGPAVGAAMLAASPGSIDGRQIMASAPRQHVRTYRPNPLWRTRYDALYPTFALASTQMALVSHELVAADRG